MTPQWEPLEVGLMSHSLWAGYRPNNASEELQNFKRPPGLRSITLAGLLLEWLVVCIPLVNPFCLCLYGGQFPWVPDFHSGVVVPWLVLSPRHQHLQLQVCRAQSGCQQSKRE